MAALTRWVLAHRKLVVAFWVVITIVGIMTADAATKAMDQKFSVPGKEGWETNQEIMRTFGGTGGDTAPLMPVVTLPAGKTVSDPDIRSNLAALETKMAKAVPGARVAGYASTDSDAFVSKDGRTTFISVNPPLDPESAFGENVGAEKDARAALKGETVAGRPVHLTGYDALVATSGGDEGPGLLLEAVIGGVGALVVLIFVFGSFLAIVPILMAIPAIMTSFLTIYGITQFAGVSPIVQFLIALIGLGVAIDYSLIVVVRWREEQAHGTEGDAAIVRAMDTAGRAVVLSGATVAIGLLALVVLPLPFLRSVGYGGMVIPLISVLINLTLLPVVLHTWGRRLDWPHKRTDDEASAAWTRWAEVVVKRRWLATGVAMIALIALVISATGMKPGISDTDTVAQSGDAKDGLVALEKAGIGKGALLPYEILVTGGDPEAVATKVAAVDGMHGAVAPTAWRVGDKAIVAGYAVEDPSNKAGRDLVDQVRGAVEGTPSKVGGFPAGNADFISAVYGNFPLMIGLIALVTFIFLARAFRSLLLPAKAVVLNIISIGAAWGVLTLVWQHGHGSDEIWGIAATGSITAWIPLMVFAFLFGLSMDYEVFILARMREEHDNGATTDEAVVRGIGRTGRLVTSAALILFMAFMSMAASPGTDIKVLATGLAAGILLDATVIRGLLVPAIVSLFGDYNWILPPWAAKILRVEPSPAVAPAASTA